MRLVEIYNMKLHTSSTLVWSYQCELKQARLILFSSVSKKTMTYINVLIYVCQIGRKLSTGCNFAKRNGWMPPYIVFFHSISENIIQEYLCTEWKRERHKLKWGGWKEGGGTRASGSIQRALTFINVDRNLLAEKCCAITTAASRAEKNWGWKHGHTVWLCPWQVMFSMNNL